MNRDEVMTFVKKSLSFLPDKSYIKLYYQLRVGRRGAVTLRDRLHHLFEHLLYEIGLELFAGIHEFIIGRFGIICTV